MLLIYPGRGWLCSPDQPVDHPGLDELVFLPSLDADQVHAVTPADVAACDPVYLTSTHFFKREKLIQNPTLRSLVRSYSQEKK